MHAKRSFPYRTLSRFRESALPLFWTTESDIERSVCAFVISIAMTMGIPDLIGRFACFSAQVTGLYPTNCRLPRCWRSTLFKHGLNSASCYCVTLWLTMQHFHVSSLYSSSLDNTSITGGQLELSFLMTRGSQAAIATLTMINLYTQPRGRRRIYPMKFSFDRWEMVQTRDGRGEGKCICHGLCCMLEIAWYPRLWRSLSSVMLPPTRSSK